MLPSLLLLSAPATMALLSLVVWSMVLAAYTSMGTKTRPEVRIVRLQGSYRNITLPRKQMSQSPSSPSSQT